MPLAEWSGKTAVEDKQYVRFPFDIRKAEHHTLIITEGKVGGRCVQCYFRHGHFLLWMKIEHPYDRIQDHGLKAEKYAADHGHPMKPGRSAWLYRQQSGKQSK